MLSRIGVLGGMGPESTIYFMQLLYRSLSEVLKPRCDQDYPDISILMENTTPNLAEALRGDRAKASQRINKAIAGLILSGCDPVVIPNITAHALIEQRWFDAGIIDFRQCIIEQLEEVYTGEVAVLALDETITSGIFEPLSEHFSLNFPNRSQQKKINSLIYGAAGLKSSDKDIPACKTALAGIIRDLQYDQTDHVLIGCTEIETFLSDSDVDDSYIMPMALMCHDIVEKFQSNVLNE